MVFVAEKTQQIRRTSAASSGSAAGCVIEVQPALNFEARVALMTGGTTTF